MAIRLRKFNEYTWVALNALKSIPKDGDIYLDNALDYALSNKFTKEHNELWGCDIPSNETQAEKDFVNQEESNNENRDEFDRRYGDLVDITKTVFVFGHYDLTQDEFNKHYAPFLDEHIHDINYYFVVGDSVGADTLIQQYFLEHLGRKNRRVTIFHSNHAPAINTGDFKTIGGFDRDQDRDDCMIANSNMDFAWVRPGREKSGTARLLLVRSDPDR